MKKISALILLLFIMITFTGCLKKYKTVEDYSNAMYALQNSFPAYTLKVKKVLTISKTDEFYYTTYRKGDKWKLETSKTQDGEVSQVVVCDGKDIYSYTPGGKFAVSMPKFKDISQEEYILSSYPLNGIFNWNDADDLIANNSSPAITNNKERRNGFDCRLISYGDNKEICVSDKYGISVYEKTSFQDKFNKDRNVETTTDVIYINNEDIDDSVFELPENIKKVSVDEAINEMKKLFNNIKIKK